jgi:hypothetical protein
MECRDRVALPRALHVKDVLLRTILRHERRILGRARRTFGRAICLAGGMSDCSHARAKPDDRVVTVCENNLLATEPEKRKGYHARAWQTFLNFTLVATTTSVATSEDIAMIDTSARAAALLAFAASVLLSLVTPAFSQAPTEAQRSAIRSECRSDYMAHCSEVPPGGMASLQCLQKNMSGLSSGCQNAVRAVEAPAEPKAEAKPEARPEQASEAKPEAKPEDKPVSKLETAPAAASATPAEKPAAAAEPKAATAAPSKKPNSAQVAAIRSACRPDYMAHCASVPTGGAAALNCLQQNKAKLSAGCQQAVNAVNIGASGGNTAAVPATGAASTDTATAAPAAVTSPMMLRPMRPREVLFVLRSACGGDVRALCGDVPPGGGRIVQCLAAQAASLSPGCHGVLASFAQ